MRIHPLAFGAPLALLCISACYDAPVEAPMTTTTQESDVRVQSVLKDKVDILFMIDNSPSMAPKQAELKNRFPLLIKTLNDFGSSTPASYHIGVVTSDLGAGPFSIGVQGGMAQCHPGGDGALLQAVGAAADSSCAAPGGGLHYIDYDQLTNSSNLPSGTATDVNGELEHQFNCMASVGDKGCGFEMQLESVYEALHDDIPENQGFLRPDALLVVVFVTDEDDCSADPNSDLFDPAKVQQYGAELSYRCTSHSIACSSLSTPGNLMPYADSGGNQAPCHDADPSVNKLIPVSRYIDYFTRSSTVGGLKLHPEDVILVDITAPDDDVESILANPTTMPPGPYVPCSGPVNGKTCDVVLQHSCVASTNSAFFGDPAVRIRQVVSLAMNNQSTSICDTSYEDALQKLGKLIVDRIGSGCIDSPFEDPMNPDCVVEDVIANLDGSQTINEVPRCDRNGNHPPCWQLQSKTACDASHHPAGCCEVVCAHDGDPGQHYGVTICRNDDCTGGDPPANSEARVACSTIAVSKNLQTGNLPMCGAVLP